MFDAKKVQWAIKSGLSAVCAQCVHYWRAQEHVSESRPLDGVRVIEAHCTQQSCGGPSIGMAFPKYKGPHSGSLLKFCYICGEDADAMVDMHGRGQLGVCKKHIEQFKSHLRRPNAPPPVVRERVVPVV